MSKKMFSLLLAACMLIGLLAGCGSNSNSSTSSGGATAAPVETTIPEAPADAADATAGTKDLVFVISSTMAMEAMLERASPRNPRDET